MTHILLQKAKLRNLPILYKLYYEALQNDLKHWLNIELQKPLEPRKISFLRAVTIHVVNIFFARLYAVSRTGSLFAIFESRWNPSLIEVLKENKLAGCIFMARQSLNVFQVNAIGSLGQNREIWVETDVLYELKKYVKKLGANRIIIRSIDQSMKNDLFQLGFRLFFSDDVLFLDFSS